MKTVGEFVYRGIEKRDAGKFINENGKEVEYGSKYVLKVDELTEKGIQERKFNVDINNLALIDRLKKANVYDKIKLELDIVMYQNSCKVVPIAICDSNNK